MRQRSGVRQTDAVPASVRVVDDPAEAAAELRAHCAGRLDFYKVPARFRFADAVPRTDLGKVRLDDHLCGLVQQIEKGLSRDGIELTLATNS